MRLATFNVHMWRDREQRASQDRVIDLLRRLACDAIALQEVPAETNTLSRVAAALKMHSRFAPATFLGNALLSVQPPRAFECFPLSAGNVEARSAFIATLGWEGGSMRFIGTHLDPLYESDRMRQLTQLLGRLRARPSEALTVLGGDLNALCLADYEDAALAGIRAHRDRSRREPPRGEVTQHLAAHGFVDLWRHAQAAQAAQADAGRRVAIGPLATCWAGTRIDYLWAGAGWAEQARLQRCEHVVTAVSDHLPVVVELIPAPPSATASARATR
jgi:endonuclease/exonuclease/phosphatase family metal-dependent hydrolase